MKHKHLESPNHTPCQQHMFFALASQLHFSAEEVKRRAKLHDSSDVQSHHSVSKSAAVLDGLVWEFALSYIQNPVLVREHITAMREQIDSKDRSAALEASLEETKEKIVNLLSVAEAARDETTRQLYRERLAALEKDMHDTELLLIRLSNTTERSQKLLTALDKFEAWAIRQQPYLADPTYEITKEDKQAALMILGVKATVWQPSRLPGPPPHRRSGCLFFQ